MATSGASGRAARSLVARATATAKQIVEGLGKIGEPESSIDSPTPAPAAASKAPAGKAPAKKAPAKKVVATKAPAKKVVATQAPAKKVVATKAPAKKVAAKAAPAATKAAATKTPAAKAPPAKAPATKKSSATKAPAAGASSTRAPRTTRTSSTTTRTSPAATTTASAAASTRKATPVKKSAPSALASLVVKHNEDPWTKAEIEEVKAHLDADVVRLAKELEIVEEDLHDLMRDAGDGAGHDQADVGATSFERDQEMTIANNARDMLTQTKHALDRIHDGSYGVCEECGEPIGKLRLMAFPRATLCMSCKKREERR